MKDLYDDSEKATAIQNIVEGFASTLEKTGSFTNDAEQKENGDVKEKEPPSAYLWVLYFLAQHYDWKRDSRKALEFIDKAISHTPTLVELWMTKARIYKVRSNFTVQLLRFWDHCLTYPETACG